jgi:hypothetical protein
MVLLLQIPQTSTVLCRLGEASIELPDKGNPAE